MFGWNQQQAQAAPQRQSWADYIKSVQSGTAPQTPVSGTLPALPINVERMQQILNSGVLSGGKAPVGGHGPGPLAQPPTQAPATPQQSQHGPFGGLVGQAWQSAVNEVPILGKLFG
ncbi:MAG: hypothetical protein JSS20_15400 [Proteobacteria bacterium]|nr:hypothetical protein [Pseudomonadota bacterium]